MSNVRGWYIYIISTISLQAVTWAVIALLRNLLIFGIDPLAVAFQIAVLVIGLPVFLAHWLWGQRLVRDASEERGSTMRGLYLYGNMAGFLAPIAANAFDLIRRLMGGFNELHSRDYRSLASGDAVIYHVIAIIVLAAMWFYHQRTVQEESRSTADLDSLATVRRLYVLGFSAAGLTLISLAVIHLIRWVMLSLGDDVIRPDGLNVGLEAEISRVLIGVPLFVIFWRWAQHLFTGSSEGERASALRKFYLYGAVFVAALSVVANATGILASLFRRILDLPSSGNIAQPVPVLIAMGLVWAYHARVLREDARVAGEKPRQAGVRRLYLYLIAAVGLAALLVGLSGVISVALRALGASFGSSLREELAWFIAANIAGLPVWLIPWRQVQAAAADPGSGGGEARRSTVRKIYLYFFLFVATMTVLSSAVYIVFRILSMVLGEAPPTLSDLGHAISFSMIAVAVWLYHGSNLRGDGRHTRREQARRLEAMRVVIVDVDGAKFGQAVADELKSEIPEIALDPIVLGAAEAQTADQGAELESVTDTLASAGLIVGPWMIAVPGGAAGAVNAQIADAVVSSPAQKLLVPFRYEGWEWAGVDRWSLEASVRQTARAVKLVLAGRKVTAHRPIGVGAIIGIILGGLFLLLLLGLPLIFYFGF